MERLLRITNALLGIIALCLVLLVASVYRVDSVATAHAQMGRNPKIGAEAPTVNPAPPRIGMKAPDNVLAANPVIPATV